MQRNCGEIHCSPPSHQSPVCISGSVRVSKVVKIALRPRRPEKALQVGRVICNRQRRGSRVKNWPSMRALGFTDVKLMGTDKQSSDDAVFVSESSLYFHQRCCPSLALLCVPHLPVAMPGVCLHPFTPCQTYLTPITYIFCLPASIGLTLE